MAVLPVLEVPAAMVSMLPAAELVHPSALAAEAVELEGLVVPNGKASVDGEIDSTLDLADGSRAAAKTGGTRKVVSATLKYGGNRKG